MKHLPTLAVLLAAGLLLIACGQEAPAPTEVEAGEAQTYRVRGKVVSVEGRNVNIHHEAIPQFVHITGKADGMDEMVMPFTLGPDVAPAALSPGDRISFDLHVRWKPEAEFWIDNLAPLPDDVKLNLKDADHHHDHDHHDHDHDHDHDHGHDHDH